MRWPWKRTAGAAVEERGAGWISGRFAEALGHPFSAGEGPAKIEDTAAVEIVAGFAERSFLNAPISGAGASLLDAPALALAARALVVRGNAVFGLADGLARIAASYELTGDRPDPESWSYQLHETGPTGTRTRTMAGSGVLHFRWRTDPRRPWRGRGLSEVAGLTTRTAAAAERQSGDHAAIRGHSLVPTPPQRFSSETALRDADTGNIRLSEILSRSGGELVMVPGSTPISSGAVSSPRNFQASSTAPPGDQARNELRRDAMKDLLAAAGLPPSLLMAGSDAAAREAQRMAAAWLRSMAAVMASEIQSKTGLVIDIEFPLPPADTVSRTRALKGMVDAGVSLDDALSAVGLDD